MLPTLVGRVRPILGFNLPPVQVCVSDPRHSAAAAPAAAPATAAAVVPPASRSFFSISCLFRNFHFMFLKSFLVFFPFSIFLL